MADLWHPDITPGEPNSGDEANLTKWGWPSPALLQRHNRDKPATGDLWTGPTKEQPDPPF